MAIRQADRLKKLQNLEIRFMWLALNCRVLNSAVRRPFLVMSSAALFLISFAVKAQEFEVKGQVKFVFITQGKEQPARTARFTFSRKDESWLIHSSGNDPSAYHELAYDGNQLCYLEKFPGSDSSPVKAGNIATAWVYKNSKILHNMFMPEAGPLWLMFASDSTFQQLSKHEIEPVITFGVAGGIYTGEPPFNFKQKAEYLLNKTTPHLPEWVAYLHDGFRRVPGSTELIGLPAPYDLGYTNAIFSVKGFTNLGPVNIPAFATLDVFRPIANGKRAADLEMSCRFEISTEEFAAKCDVAKFQPSIPGPTVFSDARFRDRLEVFTYKAQKWIPERELINMQEFKSMEARALREGKQRTSVDSWRIVIVSIIILLLTFPIVLFQTLKRKPNSKATQ